MKRTKVSLANLPAVEGDKTKKARKVIASVPKNLVRANKDETLEPETIRICKDILRTSTLKIERVHVLVMPEPDEEGHIYEVAPGFSSVFQAILECKEVKRVKVFYYT